MNYYLVLINHDSFGDFRDRMSVLDRAQIIESLEQLQATLDEGVPGNSFFLIRYLGLDEKIDELVATIRKKAPHAKVLYITGESDAHELKEHQMGPVGGDAYINPEITEKQFNQIIDGLKAPDIVTPTNRLESQVGNQFGDLSALENFKNHPLNRQIDELFASVIEVKVKKPMWQSLDTLSQVEEKDDVELEELEELEDIKETEEGDVVGTKDQELSLDDGEELDLSLGDDNGTFEAPSSDDDLSLSLDDAGADLELGEIEIKESIDADDEELSLGDDEELSLGDDEISFNADDEEGLSLSEDDDDMFSLGEDEGAEEAIENIGELSFDETPADDGLSLDLGSDDPASLAMDISDTAEDEALEFSADDSLELNLSDDSSSDPSGEPSLSFADDDSLSLSGEMDLSEDAKEKLKEIDAILDYDASQVQIRNNYLGQENLDEPLVSDELDLGNLSFEQTDAATQESTGEIEAAPVAAPKEEKAKKKKKEAPAVEKTQEYGEDLKELSTAYSGEMERMQATISNLRSDREELLAKIQTLEEEKLLHNRQTLSLRAELDERKIELTIIRKKLNEEINELKDRVKLFDEKRLILEEKNRVLAQELDKANQKNKIDLRKVQSRERELEQKLELLKADAETQIRNRDIKILELKRKIDAMEFDMESISLQEKRSVESRFELEDKLEKAIKTLRNAITVLEDESDRSNALDALKKNIDM